MEIFFSPDGKFNECYARFGLFDIVRCARLTASDNEFNVD